MAIHIYYKANNKIHFGHLINSIGLQLLKCGTIVHELQNVSKIIQTFFLEYRNLKLDDIILCNLCI